MQFKKKINKELVVKVRQYITGRIIQYFQDREKTIKKIEYIRGLYRYPKKMLGRKITFNKNNNTDILVIAAHPDDEILGLSTTLYRHSLNEDNIKVIFVTNGTGRDGESWNVNFSKSKQKAEIRYMEAVKALSLINIREENIYCLGYPDGGTQRYINNISIDIQKVIQEFNPGRVYVHCIEGGHKDHDLTSFVVKSICKKISYLNIFEWTEYNPMQPLGEHNVKFLPNKHLEIKEIKINISEEERNLKKKMLAFHNSQDVEQFFLQGEAIRKANTSVIEKELFEHCQLSVERKKTIIKEFNNSFMIVYIWSIPLFDEIFNFTDILIKISYIVPAT